MASGRSGRTAQLQTRPAIGAIQFAPDLARQAGTLRATS